MTPQPLISLSSLHFSVCSRALLFFFLFPRTINHVKLITPHNNNSGLAAGMAIGIVGDAGVRAVGQQERLFVGMILILIFAEALGLYGMIVALILSQSSYSCE